MIRNTKGQFVKQSLEEKFWQKVNQTTQEVCWIWLGSKDKRGYGTLIEYDDNNNYVKRHLSHRLSYQFNKGNIPDGLVVCHKCDNTSCVNPDHLFTGTQKDNIHDMIKKGRNASPEAKARKGAENGSAKLAENDVLEIRNKYRPRIYTVRMLANEYGVSVPLVEKILSRKVWSHI